MARSKQQLTSRTLPRTQVGSTNVSATNGDGDNGAGRMIELTITDCRESTWKNVPDEDRVQVDLALKDFSKNGDSSMSTLRDRISSLLQQQQEGATHSRSLLRNEKEFDILNPDRVKIDDSNVNKLCNHDRLVLFDKNQIYFPFTSYTQKYSTVPHTRAVTNQKGKFYGSEEHNPAALALAELVDNSLAATANNTGRRLVEIHFYEDGGGLNAAIAVLDNGSGMNSETLKTSLKYKAPKDSRTTNYFSELSQLDLDPNLSGSSGDIKEVYHPIYVNSNISKFGAGLKQAIFWLGEETRIMTKRIETENVNEVRYSRQVMEEKEISENEDPWVVEQHTGKVGVLRDVKVSPIVENIIKTKELNQLSFTHIVIQNIRRGGSGGDDNSPLDLLQRRDIKGVKSPSIEKQLAHIYHYYLHGREFFGGNNRDDAAPTNLVDIRVIRFDGKRKVISNINLRDIPEKEEIMWDLETRFAKSSTPEPFLFTIEVGQFNETSTAENFKVGGIIRYHPFMFDHETNPAGPVSRKQNQNDDVIVLDENSDEKSSSSAHSEVCESTRTCGEFFNLWWNGRLIPHTRMESFNWCSPGDRMKSSDKLYKSYGRISGSLFLNSEITEKITEITENKLNITTTTKLVEMFNCEKKIGARRSTFLRVTKTQNGQKRMAPTPKKNFEEWLNSCRKWDKQVYYSDLLRLESQSKDEDAKFKTEKIGPISCFKYGAARWDGLALKVGDAVKLINVVGNTPSVLGRIRSFCVDIENCVSRDGDDISSVLRPMEKLHAPLSHFEFELQPTPYYSGGPRFKEMRLIDKNVVLHQAEELIRQASDDLILKVNMIDDEMVPHREPGCKVPIDEVLFKKIAFHITDQRGNPLSSLAHYETKATKKNIFMVARVHRIHINNGQPRRELHYTSAICNHLIPTDKPSGYYFKNLDLKSMYLEEIGNYVITFRSYIDKEAQHGIQKSSATVPRCSRTSPIKSGSPMISSSSSLPPRRARTSKESSVQSKPNEPQRIDPAYEIEWEQEVDSIGRKILIDGNNRIRMPYFEVEFKVVAGPPQKFDIYEIGEVDTPLRIGQPFNITLCFKDSKGFATWPSNWDSLTSQKPIIITKNSGFELRFSSGESTVYENRLVIKDVVAKGFLDGSDSKECTIEVQLQMNNAAKKLRKVTTETHGKITFHHGVADKIVPSHSDTSTIAFENGSRPVIACHVKDCEGNIISFTKDRKKPIVLRCDIYKMGNTNRWDQLVCTRKVLATGTENKPHSMEEEVYLEEGIQSMTPIELRCRVFYEESSLNIVELKSPLTLHVIPSTRPTKLVLYQTIEGCLVKIEEETELVGRIKESLKLRFKLLDGLGREVAFDNCKHAIKMDWSDDLVINGDGLPEFKIPKRAEKRKEFITKLKIPGFKAKIQHKFYLTWNPLEAASKLSLCFAGPEEGEGSLEIPQIRLGQTFPVIIANILDLYGNIKTDIDQEQLLADVDITASSEDIEIEFNAVCGNICEPPLDCSFLIKQLRIRSRTGGSCLPLGEITLTATYAQQFADTLKLNMIPGAPHGLMLEINGQTQKQRSDYTLPNNSDVGVCCHLVDAFQNTTKPLGENILITFTLGGRSDGGSSKTITRKEKECQEDGKADFGVISIRADSSDSESRDSVRSSACRIKGCISGVCFGKSKFVKVEAELSETQKLSAICNFHITCRPDVPFQLIPLLGNGQQFGGMNGLFYYEAGSSFRKLTVTIEAEDGNKFTSAEKEHLIMFLTEVSDPSLKFEILAKAVHEGVYTFGEVPNKIGLYKAEFVYDNNSNFTVVETMNGQLQITSGSIVSLRPEHDLSNLSVSNDPENPQSRIIANEMKLLLLDRFGNPISTRFMNPVNVNHNLNGTVRMQLLDAEQELPLENSVRFDSVLQLEDGIVIVPQLILQSQVNLGNNTKHTIRFTYTSSSTSDHANLPQLSYDLEFTFYNDIRQQQEIRQLEIKHADMAKEIATKRKIVADVERKMSSLNQETQKLKAAELQHKNNLVYRGIILEEQLNKLITSDDVCERVNYLHVTKQLFIRQWNNKRANIRTGPWSDQPNVLGCIGSLVEIKFEGIQGPENIQRVLSWHLGARLNVVVVEFEANAHQLRKQFPEQEFMVLDITKDNYPIDWNNTSLSGPGNPVYARSLLRFTNTDPSVIASTKKVFNKILGNIIIVDKLEDATTFMKLFNQNNRFSCPTILTRDCKRLSGLGIMGGSKNEAPEELPEGHPKLGLAKPQEFYRIQQELTQLPNLKIAILETELAEQRSKEGLEILNIKYAAMCKELDECLHQRNAIQKELADLKNQYQNQRITSPPKQPKEGLPTPPPTPSRQTRSATPAKPSPDNGPPTKRPRRHL